jgi:hypothetical protein
MYLFCFLIDEKHSIKNYDVNNCHFADKFNWDTYCRNKTKCR